MSDDSKRRAVILFAHGARDPRWAEPFLRVAERVRGAAPELPMELAYLEHLEPSLEDAAMRLALGGSTSIRIVPLFFGRGGHLRVDVPARVAAMAAELPGVAIELVPPAGDDDVVIDALAAFCLRVGRD